MNITPPPLPRAQDLSHAETRLIRQRDEEWIRAVRQHALADIGITDAMIERGCIAHWHAQTGKSDAWKDVAFPDLTRKMVGAILQGALNDGDDHD